MRAELTDVILHSSMDRYGDLGIHAVIDLRRRFSRADLERAAAAVVDAFPVMGCRYEPGLLRDRWRPVGEPIGDAVAIVDAPADLEAETDRRTRAFEHDRERPFRVAQLGRGEGARLVLGVSHLAVDGAGVAAVGHVFVTALTGRAPAVPVDRRRTIASTLEGLRPWHLPALARGVASTLASPVRAALAGPREQAYPSARGPAPRSRHVVVSPDELARLKAKLAASGATINDALVAALARVGAGRSRRGPALVVYTMDLRRYGRGPRLSAANTSSILLALVPRRATGDLASAARAVAGITRKQQRHLAGPAFVLGAYALGAAAPHAIARRMTRLLHPYLVDMPLRRGLLVTNVGRVDAALESFGDDLEDVRMLGPTLAGVPAPAVVAYGFRGSLRLQILSAPGLAPEAAEELEREIREGLELG
jgi:NRPS condensation-like uncharacterized protein